NAKWSVTVEPAHRRGGHQQRRCVGGAIHIFGDRHVWRGVLRRHSGHIDRALGWKSLERCRRSFSSSEQSGGYGGGWIQPGLGGRHCRRPDPDRTELSAIEIRGLDERWRPRRPSPTISTRRARASNEPPPINSCLKACQGAVVAAAHWTVIVPF